MSVNCSVPQGFVLGLILFLIQRSKVHQFADDTNLFRTNKSVKNLNQLVNHEMKQLNN